MYQLMKAQKQLYLFTKIIEVRLKSENYRGKAENCDWVDDDLNS